jgi:hypothetical protein
LDKEVFQVMASQLNLNRNECELERKLKDAELERDILKKAIGIFPKRSMIYVFIKQ